jgi:hypothetical protein
MFVAQQNLLEMFPPSKPTVDNHSKDNQWMGYKSPYPPGYNPTLKAFVVDMYEDLSLTVHCFKAKKVDDMMAMRATPQGPVATAQVKATELRIAIARMPPQTIYLQRQFQGTVEVAEKHVSAGNHAEAAAALNSIADTVFRTPDSQLPRDNKMAVLQSLDQSWRRMDIRLPNPHAIHEGCRCSPKTGRCVEDPEGGICSEGRNAEGRWSCASSP